MTEPWTASPAAIAETEALIRPHIRTTPVIEAEGADFGIPGVTFIFKLELCQHAGAFKTRGAFANLLHGKPGREGVAAASGGNHGAAVAFAARELGVPAAIFVPEISSPAKIARIRDYGADLTITGARYQDALDACEAHVAKTGAQAVHAYDSERTILGAATTALEWERQTPELDTVLVGVGGGGLIAGVAGWFQERIPVIGVEPEACPCFSLALKAGKPVDAPAGGVAADSLGARRIGATSFAAAAPLIAETVLVSDDAIRGAQEMLWKTLQIVAEPGAATPLAALLSGAWTAKPGARIGILVSGGNTAAVNFNQ